MLSSPEEKTHWFAVWAVTGIIAVLGLFPLIGLPGAAVMEVSARAVGKLGMKVPEFNEASWGTAIILTLVMPLSIPLSHWMTMLSLPRHWLSVLGVSLLWWLLVGCAAVLLPAK